MSRIGREESSIAVALSLAYTIESLLGNTTSLKCVVESDQSIFTSCAAILLQNLDIQHPIGHIINGAVQTHHQKYRSGCNTLVLLIGYWSKCVLELIDQGIPLHQVVVHLQQGIKLCINSCKRTEVTIKEDIQGDDSDITNKSPCIYKETGMGTEMVQVTQNSGYSNTRKVTEDCKKPSSDKKELLDLSNTTLQVGSTESPLDNVEDVRWYFEGGVDPGPVDIDSETAEMLEISTFSVCKSSKYIPPMANHNTSIEPKLCSKGKQEFITNNQEEADEEFDSCFDDILPNTGDSHSNSKTSQGGAAVLHNEDSEFDSCFDEVEVPCTVSDRKDQPSCDMPDGSPTAQSGLYGEHSNAKGPDTVHLDSSPEHSKRNKNVLLLGSNEYLKSSSQVEDKDIRNFITPEGYEEEGTKGHFPLADDNTFNKDLKNQGITDLPNRPRAFETQKNDLLSKITSDLKHKLSKLPRKTSASNLLAKSRHFRTISNSVDELQTTSDSSDLSKKRLGISEKLSSLQTAETLLHETESEMSQKGANIILTGSTCLTKGGRHSKVTDEQAGKGTRESNSCRDPDSQPCHSSRSPQTVGEGGKEVRSNGLFTIRDLGMSLSHGADEIMDLAVECLEMQRNGNKTTASSCGFELSRIESLGVIGPQWSERHVRQGLVVEVDTDQLANIHKSATSLHSVLLINGDLTSSFKHLGHRQVQKTESVGKTLSAFIDTNEDWLKQVDSNFNELSITGLFVRGNVEKSLMDHCLATGIVVLQNISYKVLQALAEATEAHLLSYPADATQEDVAQGVIIGSLQSDWVNHTTPPGGDTTSYALLSTNCCDFQTAVICHTVREVVYNLEECFWHSCYRLHSAYQTRELFDGGGSVEKQCIDLLHRSAEELRKVETHSDLYRPAVYGALAEGFQQYLDTLQRNLRVHYTSETTACMECFGRKDDHSTLPDVSVAEKNSLQKTCSFSTYTGEQTQHDCSEVSDPSMDLVHVQPHTSTEPSAQNVNDCTHFTPTGLENEEESCRPLLRVYDVSRVKCATWEIAGQIVQQILMNDYEIVTGVQESRFSQHNSLNIL